MPCTRGRSLPCASPARGTATRSTCSASSSATDRTTPRRPRSAGPQPTSTAGSGTVRWRARSRATATRQRWPRSMLCSPTRSTDPDGSAGAAPEATCSPRAREPGVDHRGQDDDERDEREEVARASLEHEREGRLAVLEGERATETSLSPPVCEDVHCIRLHLGLAAAGHRVDHLP